MIVMAHLYGHANLMVYGYMAMDTGTDNASHHNQVLTMQCVGNGSLICPCDMEWYILYMAMDTGTNNSFHPKCCIYQAREYILYQALVCLSV